MRRVTGQEYATLPIGIGKQQILSPLPDIEHLVFHRHGHGLFELGGHVGILLDH